MINPSYLKTLKQENPESYENNKIDYLIKQYHVNDVDRYPNQAKRFLKLDEPKVTPAPKVSESPALNNRFTQVKSKPSKANFLQKLSKLF
jgi:hypothetical protein